MTVEGDIRYWANRKAKADAMPASVREQFAETYKAVCSNLQKLMDAVFTDAVAVIDTCLDAKQVDDAARVMDACIAGDAIRAADAVAEYNARWNIPLGFTDVDADEIPEEWKS